MSALQKGLSGYVPVRNGDKLDYAWREAVASLLPVCDEVIISVGLTLEEPGEICAGLTGDDGTLLAARDLARANPKIRFTTDVWSDAVNIHMLKEWLNRIRAYCRYSQQITLDADEVLDPCSYPRIRQAVEKRESLWFYRINLWGTPEQEAPWGTVCGERVARCGPTDYYMPSDGFEYPEPPIRQEAQHDASLVIWHLGFMRRTQAFYDKSRVVQRKLLNSYDSRLAQAEETGQDWVKLCPFIDQNTGKEIPLRKHGRAIPEDVKTWLRARGHKC